MSGEVETEDPLLQATESASSHDASTRTDSDPQPLKQGKSSNALLTRSNIYSQMTHGGIGTRKIHLVVLGAQEGGPWAGLEDPFTAFLPYYSDDQTVQFDDKIQITSVKQQRIPAGRNSLDQLVKQASETTSSNLTDRLVVAVVEGPAEGDAAERSQLWLHPERNLLLCTNIRKHPNFKEPQMLIEELFADYYRRLAQGAHKIPDSPQYLITITLLVERSTVEMDPKLPKWQISEAAHQFFLSLVEQLRGIADIKVNYRIKPHVEMVQDLVSVKEGRFIIPVSRLPSFVDDNRWDVAGTTFPATAINLLVFLPSAEHRPLQVEGQTAPADGNAYFAYRQWGGVVILNNLQGDETVLTTHHLRPAMSYFAGLLKDFVGGHLALSEDQGDSVLIKVIPSTRNTGISMSEYEGLLHRALHNRIASTIRTLAALQRLLTKNGEIAVLSGVGTLVAHSLQALRLSESKLDRGEWDGALKAATEAMQWADRAFFHPTMMAHQYFPQEHKLGVYLPLFFPFVLPVLIASASICLLFVRSRLRPTKAKAQ